MTDQEKQARRGCFKYGCFGCLGVAGLAVIAAGVIALFAVVQGPPERDIVEAEVVRELPGFPALPTGTIDTDRGDGVAGGELIPLSGQAGRVVLDLSGGEFHVTPGEPGEPIRVGGTYNAGAYELTEEFRQEEAGWTWRVRFKRSVSWTRMLHTDQHEGNRIEISLPPGLPFSLEGRVGQGVSRIELGGLSVRGVELDLSMGEHAIDFSEPVPEPLERFEVGARMGEYRFGGLGNASPPSISLRGRMGEATLDLRGDWQGDATITASWTMGACIVRVPDDVHLDTDGVTVFLGEASTSALARRPTPPAGAPTLDLNLSASMGEMQVRP